MTVYYEFMFTNNVVFLAELVATYYMRAKMRQRASFSPNDWEYRVTTWLFRACVINTFIHAPLEALSDPRLIGGCPMYGVSLIFGFATCVVTFWGFVILSCHVTEVSLVCSAKVGDVLT